jgi:hypothetical protein
MKCYRCKREMKPWPLKRADVCSSKDWVSCIRWPNEKDAAHGATPDEIRRTTIAGRCEVNLMRALAYLDDAKAAGRIA